MGEIGGGGPSSLSLSFSPPLSSFFVLVLSCALYILALSCTSYSLF